MVKRKHVCNNPAMPAIFKNQVLAVDHRCFTTKEKNVCSSSRVCYCFIVISAALLFVVAEHHESRTAEQDPRGGAGARQNVAQCHTQRPTRCRPDDQGLLQYIEDAD